MQTKIALAIAGSVLVIPSTALAAAAAADIDTTGRVEKRASGWLTHDAEHRERLVRRNVRLARREARLSGERLGRGYARRVRDDAVSVLRARNTRLRGRVAKLERRERSATAGAASTASPPLQAIAACESGGDPSAIGGGGMYRGKYQFSTSTWASVGGKGDPAAASEAEQDKRAAMLYAQAGASPWPVCGR